jgi:hypothetical protein
MAIACHVSGIAPPVHGKGLVVPFERRWRAQLGVLNYRLGDWLGGRHRVVVCRSGRGHRRRADRVGHRPQRFDAGHRPSVGCVTGRASFDQVRFCADDRSNLCGLITLGSRDRPGNAEPRFCRQGPRVTYHPCGSEEGALSAPGGSLYNWCRSRWGPQFQSPD